MNFADLNTVPSNRSTPHADPSPIPTLGDVVARVSAEVSMPLSAALDRVLALASSGRIDRPGLKALRDEIEDARRAGLRGQQIARFASGQVRQSMERLDLSRMLANVLAEQAEKPLAGSIGSQQSLAAAEIMGDPTLVNTLLQATVDWSMAVARASVEWRLDIKPWPVRARLGCRFAHRPADLAGNEAPPASRHLDHLDTLDWLLLQYSAHVAGVVVQREDSASHTSLTLEFLHTVNDTLEGVSAVELGASEGAAGPMAGSQVLVLAARRDARAQVRTAMQGHELIVDYVPTVADARSYCDEGLPHVLVYESSFEGAALQSLRDRLAKSAPGLAMIEILPAGRDWEMGSEPGDPLARIGADGLRQLLPAVMVLALSQRR